MRPEVKICGLTRPEDAAAAAAAGAAFLGVIFAESKRRVAADRAREILDAGGGVQRVGVFGSSNAHEILETATTARLDVLQLHGKLPRDDVWRLRQHFPGQIWGVVRVSPAGVTDEEWAEWDRADAVVVDTWREESLGGSGVRFDWSAAAPRIRALRGARPLVLAGGLTAETVADGIAVLAPDIVDVSSGVEHSTGVKDPARVAAFVRAAKGEQG